MPNAVLHPTDRLIGTGLITAETIASELRAKLASRLSRAWLPEWELLEIAQAILTEYEPILAEALANVSDASWLTGFSEVAKKIPDHLRDTFAPFGTRPPGPPAFKLPGVLGGDEPELRFPIIEKAAQDLLSRNILTRPQFDLASQQARNQAFTVAGEMRVDALATIRDTLAETVQEGASLRVFKEKLGADLEGSFLGPAHIETTFRTNVQQAFSNGHEALAEHPIVADIFPYREYLAIHDARARHDHLALESLGIDGTPIYRNDDHAFWDLFLPPWGYNCRCGTRLVRVEEAARRGVREAEEWLTTGRKPPLQSRLPFITFRPPVGFGGRRQGIAA